MTAPRLQPKVIIFEVAWRPGRRVQEVAFPFRKGTITRRLRTGHTATIFVALDGGPVTAFTPDQLTLL